MSDDSIQTIVIGSAIFLYVLYVAVTEWPWLRERRIRFRRVIAAPRQAVFDLYVNRPGDTKSAALHNKVISQRVVDRNPEIWEQVFRSAHSPTETQTMQLEVLHDRPPEKYAYRARQLDDREYPLGRMHHELLELEEHPSGTLATLRFAGETVSLGAYVRVGLVLWRHLRALKLFAESDGIPASKGNALWVCLAVSLLSVASFAYLWGLRVALLISAVLVFHEFGHWLAMRMTGQTAPRMTLVPFLGGVAIPNQPHISRFNESFCFLMGPGLSVVPTLVLMFAVLALAPLEVVDNTLRISTDIGGTFLGSVAVPLLLMTGLLNLLQLAPVLPLDGGQLVRSMAQSFHIAIAKWGMILLTGGGAALAWYMDEPIGAIVLGLGLIQAWFMTAEPSGPRPMGMLGATVMILAYLFTIAVHLSAAAIGWAYLQALG